MDTIKEYTKIKDLVKDTLRDYPDTRNNDNKLFLQCLKNKGASKLEDIVNIDLNLITIHKTRQKIQNVEGKYRANKVVQELRNNRSVEVREFMKN